MMDPVQRLHVAVGVVCNHQQQVLITRRAHHQHQGGLWEFPGGKVEPGEDVLTALGRELHEELGITVQSARPLIRIPYDYPDRPVLLDVWRVEQFTGEAHGREQQPLQWVAPERLSAFAFPAANVPITRAVQLPETCLVTGHCHDEMDFMQRLYHALARGVGLVQFRSKQLQGEQRYQWVRQARQLCHQYGARLILNDQPSRFDADLADGLHLSSRELMACGPERPLSEQVLLSASVHNLQQLQKAMAIGVDFVLLAPVKATQTHPDVVPLGWDRFAELTDYSTVPVYALGGLKAADLQASFNHGGQGIAAISEFWEKR